MTTCTAEDCYRETSLYLCTDCIVELDGLLKDVGPLVQFLDGPIHNMSVTRSPGAGGGSGHPGSKPAMNVDAWLLKAWLCQLPDRAHATAMDNPDAGKVLYMAREWVPRARDLVWGPEDKRVYGRCEEPIDSDEETDADDEELKFCDGQLVAHPDDVSVKCPACMKVHLISDILARLRARARGEPMPPRAVREYLHRKARVMILKKDFENWVQLGRLGYVLDRVTTTGNPQRVYYPGDVLKVFEHMRARRRVPL